MAWMSLEEILNDDARRTTLRLTPERLRPRSITEQASDALNERIRQKVEEVTDRA